MSLSGNYHFYFWEWLFLAVYIINTLCTPESNISDFFIQKCCFILKVSQKLDLIQYVYVTLAVYKHTYIYIYVYNYIYALL